MSSVLENLQAAVSLVSERPYVALAGTLSVASAAIWWHVTRRPKRPPPGPPNTIVVYGFANTLDTPSLSPFVLKLESYLKLAKLPYVVATEYVTSHEGKVPWISYNGEEIADSQFCIEFLKERFGVDLNKGLTKEEKAVSYAFRVMLDEFHFWCNVHFRLYDPNDKQIKSRVPSYRARLWITRRYKGFMYAQGIGRHSELQIVKLFQQNLQMLDDFLGDKQYLMGNEPTEVDCSVFGLVGQLIFYPAEAFEKTFGKDYVKKSLPRLYQMCMRIKERTYPDYPL